MQIELFSRSNSLNVCIRSNCALWLVRGFLMKICWGPSNQFTIGFWQHSLLTVVDDQYYLLLLRLVQKLTAFSSTLFFTWHGHVFFANKFLTKDIITGSQAFLFSTLYKYLKPIFPFLSLPCGLLRTPLLYTFWKGYQTGKSISIINTFSISPRTHLLFMII